MVNSILEANGDGVERMAQWGVKRNGNPSQGAQGWTESGPRGPCAGS